MIFNVLSQGFDVLCYVDGWSPQMVRDEGEHRIGMALPKIPERDRSRKEALWSEHRVSSKRS